MAKKKAGAKKGQAPSGANQGPKGKKKAPKVPEMAFPPPKTLQKDLLAASGISRKELTAVGLDWKELAAIYEDHDRAREELEDTASFVSAKLRRLEVVHSVRSRVKNPGHLVAKVLRKTKEDSDRQISFSNYKEQITDRIGIRALHLFKEDWLAIHQFVTREWDLIEEPIAYHREGDHEEWLAAFSREGCRLERHPRRYRSVHYLIQSAGSKVITPVELQVRTVFEEAWSEIDHSINYPVAAPEPVGLFLEVFNRLAGSADEMGSFINRLTAELGALNERAEQAEAETEKVSSKVDELIAQLEISEGEKTALRRQVKKLGARRSGSTGSGGIPLTIGGESTGGVKYLTSDTPSMMSNIVAFDSSGALLDSGTRKCRSCGTEVPRPSAFNVTTCPACGAIII